MKDRIKKFIEYKGINPGELASRLEVQRSNISHILNGRNKPGAALIEKILVVFPDLNARWLLTGEGSMLYEPSNKLKNEVTPIDQSASESTKKSNSDKHFDKDEPIAKVVLLYKDGTFQSFGNK